MRGYADEDNLHARIYALRSRLLSLKDYIALARNQDNILYGRMADNSDPIKIGEIVFREQINSILPLIQATEIYAPLFLAFLRQFEVLNLKLLLAKAFGLQSMEQWYDIEPYAILKRNLLEETVKLKNIQCPLAGTYLAAAFEDVSRYEQAEALADLCAQKNMYAAFDSYTPESKRYFQELMTRRMAITAMILSLRLKKTYRWDDEKIHLFLVKHLYTLDVMKTLQVENTEKLWEKYIGQQRANGAREPTVADIEHYLEQQDYRWVSSLFHRDYHSISCVVAFLWLLYYQIKNLFKIIEGRRFGFSPERIVGGIVCSA